MSKPPLLTRRSFLKVVTTTGAGLMIQGFLSGCTPSPQPTSMPIPTGAPQPTANPSATPEPPAWLYPNVFVKIGNDGLVTVTVAKSEMGQGVRTALPMILAEELGADWTTIQVEQAPGNTVYGDQLTGGSGSIADGYFFMRQAGAVARALLLGAAAQTWGVSQDDCLAENGLVTHKPSGRQLPFGRLVDKAATLPVPNAYEVATKPDTDPKRIIGTRVGRLDNPDIVTGRAIYGLDVQLPGLLVATVARAPTLGGSVMSFDDTQAKAVAGVRQVVQIDSGVAVVAENTWAALKGREALSVTWDEGPNIDVSTTEIMESLIDKANDPATPEGNVLEAVYAVPYLAHATMEPMNCVADVRPDSCEIWAPTQNPMVVKQTAAQWTNLHDKAITVHVTLLGGGFGRRLEGGMNLAPLPVGTDYVSEAVQLSRAVAAPVQVVWTREDDFQHDIYHPLTVVRMRANLDRLDTPNAQNFNPAAPIPSGNWRAVENVLDAFSHESFLDEYAVATGVDPLELRRSLLPARAMAVLDLAATKAGWGTPLPAGHGRGLAHHATWGTTDVAMVAEVSVSAQGQVQVHRVVCAVDCGLVISPDGVEAQIEGGIIYGLTAALKDAISVEQGRVQQTNFHNAPLLRFDEAPQIEVHIMPSNPTDYPRGMGEMGNPVIMPALANAIFAATGKRIRRLPIRAADLAAS